MTKPATLKPQYIHIFHYIKLCTTIDHKQNPVILFLLLAFFAIALHFIKIIFIKPQSS